MCAGLISEAKSIWQMKFHKMWVNILEKKNINIYDECIRKNNFFNVIKYLGLNNSKQVPIWVFACDRDIKIRVNVNFDAAGAN